jgi:hypothetical protein
METRPYLSPVARRWSARGDLPYLNQDSQFCDRRSVPPVVLKWVSIAPGPGTQRSIQEF